MEIIDLKKINTKDNFNKTNNSFAKEFLKSALKKDVSIKEFNELFNKLIKNSPNKNYYSFVGDNENNSSNIEVSTDPGRSLMERVTNAIDSSLELMFYKREGKDHPFSPHDAAQSWLGIIKEEGIKSLSYKERMEYGDKFCKIGLLPGDGPAKRILDVIDQGIGITQNKFKDTILSISWSNKIGKAGFY